ncbi:MAG: lipopolysaccharide biosynthesis [Paracoccaceae bacterium]|nr:lipopolysaccharide biosynthesis [Paracoccaceae bacterium]
MNLDFTFYRMLLIRRLPIMLLILIIGSAAGLATAIKLPAIYETEARLLVESPRIPDELAASTVRINTGEQLEILRERLLTRETLIDLANEFDVFENLRSMAPDVVVDKMRGATRIASRDRRNSATIVSISFASEDPEISARVANGYVTLLLDENVRMRTGLAENTLDFFELEVERLSNELSDQSAKILAFKTENSEALPDGQDFRLNRQSILLERQRRLEGELESIRDQRARVTEIYQSTGRVRGLDENNSPAMRQLRQLERELVTARATFSENNPKLKVIETRIELLRQQVDAELEDGSVEQTAEQTMFNLTIAEFEARTQTINEELVRINAELDTLAVAIQRTPQVAIELDFLERDYDNIRDQYNSAVDRLAAASTGERIEVTAQGQRITLIEEATVPRSPTSPNRPVIVSAGVSVGLGAAIALFVFLELINSTVRRPAELTSALGIAPLATIPFIDTRESRRRRLVKRLTLFLIVFVALPALMWAVHSFYMPLDDALDVIFAQLGLI